MPWGYAAAGVASAAAGSALSKGGSGGTTQSTQNQAPWENVAPHLNRLFYDAAEQYGAGPYNYVANQSPFTQQAQQMSVQRAQDPNSILGRSQSLVGDTINGKYLSPDSNPYLKASVQDALGMAGSAFAGQYGGPAGQNLGNSGYQESLARGLGATATNAYANAYGTERQNQLNALQLAPTIGNADINQLAGVGAQQEALKQAQYQSPWNNLSQYQSMLAGNFGGSTVSQNPYFTNPLATAMGAGIGGLTLYNQGQKAGLFGQPQQQGSNPFPNYSGQNLGQSDFSGGFY